MIAICGTQQASIAWPDRPAERFIVDDMARNGVEEVVPLDDLPQWKPPTVAEVLEQHGVKLPAYQKAPESFTDAMVDAPGGEVVVPEGLTIAADGTVTPALGSEIVPDGQGGAVVVPDAPIPTAADLVDPPAITEAQAIRNYLNDHGTGTPNKVVIAALKEQGYKIESTQVSAVKKEIAESAQSIAS